MAALPEVRSLTVDAIYAVHEAAASQERRRGHLGGSAIGRSCSRELWYSFRWAARPVFDGRMLRLFGTGHREEERLIAELRRVGLEVHDKDERGKQWSFARLGGHFSGSFDAVVLGVLEAPKTWHLLECKTANTKRFAAVRKNGVQRAEPTHYAQMQTYMGWAGLERAFYLVVCKDTDEIYPERVPFDREAFERLEAKAAQIIRSPEPLSKVSHDPVGYPCGFCDFNELCHADRVADVNCRTCAHSTPIVDESEDARWKCEKYGHDLTRQDQERGCGDHIYIPALVPFAEPVDGGTDHVVYQIRKKTQRFVNAGSSSFPALDLPTYGSTELHAIAPEAIGNEVVEAVRATFGPVTETP
jgi:hypothetical protein